MPCINYSILEQASKSSEKEKLSEKKKKNPVQQIQINFNFPSPLFIDTGSAAINERISI